jgi:SSS family solute:Na+ symporter/sodium/pantothenate symporter
MTAATFSIALLLFYAVLTYGLSALGMRKTTSLRSFAVGKGDMSPVLAGITMAASIASTATFVINPGFVYKDGLSAWAHYGLGAMLGLITALLILSRGFQRLGNRFQAVTLPAWIRSRFGSRGLGLLFAAMTLLYITFVVLILAGSALIVQGLFGLGYHTALVALLLFCFGYVLMGGTYAHAYTNAFQGVLMMGIAVVVFASGAEHLGSGFSERLAAVSVEFSSWINPGSDLYNGFFAVFASSFLITFALMLQPHIVTKVLYLKESPRDMNRFLAVAIGASLLFSLMLFVGFYAKLDGLEVARQDKVVVEYIAASFNPWVVAFIFMSLLAAGMSTLDGILVSMSAIVVSDFFLTTQTEAGAPRSPLSSALHLLERGVDRVSGLIFGLASGGRRVSELDEEEVGRVGLALSRYVLVLVGLVSLALAWDPPARLGLFAQQGVYALVAASCAPVVLGILSKREMSGMFVGSLSLSAVVVHFALRWGLDVINPSVSAAIGILVSLGLGALGLWVSGMTSRGASHTARVS